MPGTGLSGRHPFKTVLFLLLLVVSVSRVSGGRVRAPSKSREAPGFRNLGGPKNGPTPSPLVIKNSAPVGLTFAGVEVAPVGLTSEHEQRG